jgi:hypothetical protein
VEPLIKLPHAPATTFNDIRAWLVWRSQFEGHRRPAKNPTLTKKRRSKNWGGVYQR